MVTGARRLLDQAGGVAFGQSQAAAQAHRTRGVQQDQVQARHGQHLRLVAQMRPLQYRGAFDQQRAEPGNRCAITLRLG